MIVLIGVIRRRRLCTARRYFHPQGVGAEGAARCIAVALRELAVAVRFGNEAFCAVEVVGGVGLAAVVQRLADASAEGVVTIGGDDGVTGIVDFDEAVVGVVHVASCVRRVVGVGLAEGVAVFVVAVADTACLDELVVFVIGPGGGGSVSVGEAVGQWVVAVGLVGLDGGAAPCGGGVGGAGEVVLCVVAVVGGACLGGFADDVAGEVVAVLVVHHLALPGVFDGEFFEAQQAVVAQVAYRAAG